MTLVLARDFETNLGIIRTSIESDHPELEIYSEGLQATTFGHKIRLESFQIQESWLPGTTKFETSIGWRWFIEKNNDKTEKLIIYCHLIDPKKDIIYGPASGEHLDAIIVKNKFHELHIGTEDGEIMHYRAEKKDWMPERHKDELCLEKSFTEYVPFGFETTVPHLKKNEKIYFHYLVATNPIRQSTTYPSETDISTWLAVDQSKEDLDKYLKTE